MTQEERDVRNAKIAKLYNSGMNSAILARRFLLTQNGMSDILAKLEKQGKIKRRK